jgi:hypothetical protein
MDRNQGTDPGTGCIPDCDTGPGRLQRTREGVALKPLRLLVLGMGIGVLAILACPQPASAAVDPPRDTARQLRPVTAFPGIAASRSTYPHPQPARRPGPQHPSRTARTTSHPRLVKRPRVNDHAAALGLEPTAPELAAAWRIGFFRSLPYRNRDGSVISGRGPPRAGPSFSAIQEGSSDRSMRPCPAPTPAIPSASLFASVRSTRPSISNRSNSNPIRSFAPGAALPSRAAGLEGTPARLVSPSTGELS